MKCEEERQLGLLGIAGYLVLYHVVPRLHITCEAMARADNEVNPALIAS